MMNQYQAMKKKYPDAILFFRLGDFYEMFFEDAVEASRLLQITLTARNKGDHKAPMCGVPYHAVSSYIAKLTKLGRKVAICEQMSDPNLPGIVKREVVRVVTPGTTLDESILEQKTNNFLVAIVEERHKDFEGQDDGRRGVDQNDGGQRGTAALGNVDRSVFGLASTDISTGELRVTELASLAEVEAELSRIKPREVIVPSVLMEQDAFQALQKADTRTFFFAYDDGQAGDAATGGTYDAVDGGTAKAHDVAADGAYDAAGGEIAKVHGAAADDAHDAAAVEITGKAGNLGVLPGKAGARAAAMLLHYLKATQKTSLAHLQQVRTYELAEFMPLDESTLRNLELTESMREHAVQGSLLGVLDETVTSMGGRALRFALTHPLLQRAAIQARLDAVEELHENQSVLEDGREILKHILDLERMISRLSLAQGNARDLIGLKNSLMSVPSLQSILMALHSAFLKDILADMDAMPDVVQLIQRAILDEPPLAIKEGGMIKDGYHQELDELKKISREGKGFIQALQAQEIERTGINSLKVRFNSVFGYYIEISKTNLHAVPADYIRKQTLVNAERFITPALKEYEEKVLGAEEKIVALEYEIFQQIREQVVKEIVRMQKLAQAIARMDMVAAFAFVALKNHYCKPIILPLGERIQIEAGRHPVVENMNFAGQFVANDCFLSGTATQVVANDCFLSGTATQEVANDCLLSKTAAQEVASGNPRAKGVINSDDHGHPGTAGQPGKDAQPLDHQLLLITGPNMGGKSTYLRQVALIVLMAHLGCFVPAAHAEIGLVDRIFTRVGASDNLVRGQSTFMVEMQETAYILKSATPHSLIILDEIGRGTSTYDGMSIAWAITEFIHDHLGAKTLFATHYHELIALAEKLPRAVNYSVAVREIQTSEGRSRGQGKEAENPETAGQSQPSNTDHDHAGSEHPSIVFLYKIVKGGVDRSYGIEVAKLAGLPGEVVNKARQILVDLEEGVLEKGIDAELNDPRKHVDQDQLGMFMEMGSSVPTKPQHQQLSSDAQQAIRMDRTHQAIEPDERFEELKKLNLNELTPLEALQKLHDWQKKK